MIKYKNQIYKDRPGRKSNHNFQFHFRYIQDLVTKIDQAKRKYYENTSRKLSLKSVNPKKYWFLPKTLLKGKKYLLYQTIHHNNKFISEIKAKCERLIYISQYSARLVSIIANFQQDLQLIPIPFQRPLISLLSKIVTLLRN